ncbi:unnamed protein product, partial [Amoebophrya sp. A25]
EVVDLQGLRKPVDNVNCAGRVEKPRVAEPVTFEEEAGAGGTGESFNSSLPVFGSPRSSKIDPCSQGSFAGGYVVHGDQGGSTSGGGANKLALSPQHTRRSLQKRTSSAHVKASTQEDHESEEQESEDVISSLELSSLKPPPTTRNTVVAQPPSFAPSAHMPPASSKQFVGGAWGNPFTQRPPHQAVLNGPPNKGSSSHKGSSMPFSTGVAAGGNGKGTAGLENQIPRGRSGTVRGAGYDRAERDPSCGKTNRAEPYPAASARSVSASRREVQGHAATVTT